MSICPRCESKIIESMCKAPKNNAWEVMICKTCLYSWRNTESAAQTLKENYPEEFKLTSEQISTMRISPPITKK